MSSTNKSFLEENTPVKTDSELSNSVYHLTRTRLEHIMTASQAVIYSCEPGKDFAFNFISKNIIGLLGFAPREFIEGNKHWGERIHPEEKEKVIIERSELYERGIISQDYRILHKDGTYRWIHDELSLIADNEGNPDEIVGSWNEITEQKEAQRSLEDLNNKLKDQIKLRTEELKQLNQSLEQEIQKRVETEKELSDSQIVYQSLIKNADIYMTALNKDGVYIATSERNASRLIKGGKPEDIVGKNLYDFHPKERADKYMEEIQEMCRTGKGVICERLAPHYESEHWHRINFFPIKDTNDEVIGIHAVSYDIHEHKLSEENLRQERNLLRTLIDSLPNLIYIRDKDGRFIIINKEYARNFGLKHPDEAIGRKLTDLVSSEREESANESFEEDQEILESGRPLIDKERVNESMRGKTIQLSTKLPWRDEEGNILGIVGSALDITYLKETEKALSGERNLLRTLIDQLPIYIFVRDTMGKFIVINKEYANDLKLKEPQEAIGKTILELLPHQLKDEGQKSLDEDKEIIISGRPLINNERNYKSYEGESTWEITTKLL